MNENQIKKIALCSFDPRGLDPTSNLERCSGLAQLAKSNGATLILFPEMTLTGFEMETADHAESGIYGTSLGLDGFRRIAQETGIAIGAGLVHQNAPERPLNQLILWSSTGQELTRYSKIHPFSLGKEPDYFSSGVTPQMTQVDEMDVGLSICYDLRFPEIFRSYAGKASVMINIACWPQRREAHWRLLCAARALENRCFFIGVNRTGVDTLGLQYGLSSGIWNPDGLEIPATFENDCLKIVEIDLGVIRKMRLALPAIKDRRPDLYKNWF